MSGSVVVPVRERFLSVVWPALGAEHRTLATAWDRIKDEDVRCIVVDRKLGLIVKAVN